MSVLIVSLPGDAHALAVKWGLEAKGVRADILCWVDYPQKVSVSYEVKERQHTRLRIVNHGECLPDDISTIWNHRTTKAEPPADIDRADHGPIVESSDWVLRGLASHVERHGFAANPAAAKWCFDNKLAQLDVAREIGLKVPQTLISNDVAQIRDFLAMHGACIVKPIRFMKWNTGVSDVNLYATPIDSIDGFDPIAISACPMIYQSKIRKRHEYRTVIFGREIINYRIESQADASASNDWREIDYRDLVVAPEALSAELEAKVLALMDRCGLVYGSLDFAVDEDGEAVFFEVNETGQFLWLEEVWPAIPLLDMFCDFLAAGTRSFRYQPKVAPVRFADWLQAGREDFLADLTRHVPAKIDKRYPDHLPLAG